MRASRWNLLKELPMPFLLMSLSTMYEDNSALPARTADNTWLHTSSSNQLLIKELFFYKVSIVQQSETI